MQHPPLNGGCGKEVWLQSWLLFSAETLPASLPACLPACTTLYYTVPHQTTLYYTVPHCTTLYHASHHVQGWQQERQRAAGLQKELDFFKASSARAIAERDRAAFDAQSVKAELEARGSTLQETKAQLLLAQQVRQQLHWTAQPWKHRSSSAQTATSYMSEPKDMEGLQQVDEHGQHACAAQQLPPRVLAIHS